jgi:hydrogenase nickel incorporation protein HypA/HybF
VHELALAEAVIEAALDTARRENITRLTRIVIGIGELQAIERDTFEFALGQILPAAEPRIAEAEIALEIEPARFCCRPCGHVFGLDATAGPANPDDSEAIHFIPELAHAFLRCPRCQSPDFELTQGRGVMLRRLEGD